ncbi:polysaccharide deacetylase family protein [uncultured Gilvimarinus sp.]|uniref:polysaccharide deacetylase family protein n=1 Tax=uncultured Gilvimarinus sp. TaxID=1689143 RepID=UPI0030EEB314|tara:strand:- start:821 stop:1888 length:1068 start_codon:yes stop_codon:yes gene_type:complete
MYRQALRKILLLWLFISAPGYGAVILQYHHVSDKTPGATSTSPERFKQHLDYLKQHQFRVIPLPELIERIKKGELSDEKIVAITFDDGYRSVYEVAFPLLQKYQFAFTVFVNSTPIDRGAGEFVTWAELNEMAKAGGTIANHTASHPHMVRLLENETTPQWRKRMSREVTAAEEAIKKQVGQSVKFLAYPYGEFDAKVTALMEELGFVGFGQHSGAVGVDADVLRLPRFPMGANFGKLETFSTKVNTLPLAVKDRQLLGANKQPLSEAVVAAGSRPAVQLTLAQAPLASRLHCYLQGEPLPVEVEGAKVLVKAARGLTAGRSRFNCTARADDGRYYWYSQPWLVTGEQGQWQHED